MSEYYWLGRYPWVCCAEVLYSAWYTSCDIAVIRDEANI